MAKNTPPGGQNLFGASDKDSFSSMPGVVDKFTAKMNTGLGKTLSLTEKLVKNAERYRDIMLQATTGGKGIGGQTIGLGTSFHDYSRGTKMAVGYGAAAAAGAGIAYAMAPNTMSAVTQRIYADSVAGLSGMGSEQLIGLSNDRVGMGATSAYGPTSAAATLAYKGGYLANTVSAQNIMGQIGGMSALTGTSNEQTAAAFAGINAMGFLKGGIRARDRQGNLVSPDSLINQTYRFLYGGRKITAEQAMMVMNPGSKGYASLMQLTGGNQELMQQLQMGIVARARAGGRELTAADLNNSDKAFDLLGVGKESPLRSISRFNTSEARKLQSTERGLVGGYNVALRTSASVNDAFSTMADILGPVNDGLMTLKGILQTLPGAGNTGATISGLGSMGVSMGANLLQLSMMARMLGAKGAGIPGIGFLGGTGGTGAAAMGSTLLKSGGLAIGAMAAGGAADYLNKHVGGSSALHNRGMAAAKIGQYALTGAALGNMIPIPGIGAGIGATLGTIYGGIKYGGQLITGRGPESGAIGGDSPMSSAESGSSGTPDGKIFAPPTNAPVTSPYGPRPEAAKRNPGISAYHKGIDYGLPVGSPVYAAADGVVEYVGRSSSYGDYIIIKHAIKSTLYAHLSKFLVSKGQKVVRGQQIALSGGERGAPGAGNSRGPHLHFEIRDHGGPGAGGRENPTGFFGKGFAALKNFGSKIISGLKMAAKKVGGYLGLMSDEPEKDESNLADYDAPIGASFANPNIKRLLRMFGSGPVNYQKLVSGINVNEKKYLDYLNNTDTPGRGGEVGIVGGSREGLMKALYTAGFRGDALKTAFAVSLSEAGGRNTVGDEDRVNAKYGPSYGPLQVRSLKNWKKYDDPYRDPARLKDPQYALKAAYIKSKQGKDFGPWTDYNNGYFLRYMDDANRTYTATFASNAVGGDNDGGLATEADSPMGSRSSSATFTNSSKVDITVNMNVNIARSSTQEAEHMANQILKRIEQKLKQQEIGVY